MKKILFILAIGALFAANANPPAANAVPNDVDRDVAKYYTISGSTGFDTIAGATDSSTLYTSGVLGSTDRGCGWYLVRDAITGTGADSVKLQVIVDALDQTGNLLYRSIVDSIGSVSSACPGEVIRLPIGETVMCERFRVKLLSYTDNGGQVILNRNFIYKSTLPFRKTY